MHWIFLVAVSIFGGSLCFDSKSKTVRSKLCRQYYVIFQILNQKEDRFFRNYDHR